MNAIVDCIRCGAPLELKHTRHKLHHCDRCAKVNYEGVRQELLANRDGLLRPVLVHK